MPEFLYLIRKTTYNINKGIKSNFTIIYAVENPDKANGSNIKKNFSKDDYIDVTKRVSKFISKHMQAPNYATSKIGKIQYQTLIRDYTKYLAIKDL